MNRINIYDEYLCNYQKKKKKKNILKRLTFREVSTLYYENIMTKTNNLLPLIIKFLTKQRKEVLSYENTFYNGRVCRTDRKIFTNNTEIP